MNIFHCHRVRSTSVAKLLLILLHLSNGDVQFPTVSGVMPTHQTSASTEASSSDMPKKAH